MGKRSGESDPVELNVDGFEVARTDDVIDTGRGRWPSWQRLLIGLVIASLVGFAALRVTTTRQVSPSGTAAQHPSSSGVARGRAASRDPTRCPATLTCVTTDAVPLSTIAAAENVLHGARPTLHRTVMQTHPFGLYYRHLVLHSGPLILAISVERAADLPGVQPTSLVGEPTGQSRGYLADLVPHGFFVQIQFVGPSGFGPPMIGMRKLAHDPALLATK